MSLLRRRGVLVLLTVLGALLVVVAASRTWLSGTVDDAVLGAHTASATGADSATGVVALALVVVAGSVAAATTGPRIRLVALTLTGLAALGGIATIVRALLDPGGVLGPIAAASAGRTGSIPVDGSANAWPWVALTGFALATAALLGLTRHTSAKRGLPQRYDAPRRDARPASEWDQLTAGEDPTDVGPASHT